MTKGLLLIPQRYEFSSKSQLTWCSMLNYAGCCWYHKGTNFQANHNQSQSVSDDVRVVADTTKVRIFKQITTRESKGHYKYLLLLIPQRYEFSSKSQRFTANGTSANGCCWYHKGTNFQANHNWWRRARQRTLVVADTTKVRIFKQITTDIRCVNDFSCCCWYHKGTNFQANHNYTFCFRLNNALLLIPQRYEFSSKSQPRTAGCN